MKVLEGKKDEDNRNNYAFDKIVDIWLDFNHFLLKLETLTNNCNSTKKEIKYVRFPIKGVEHIW